MCPSVLAHLLRVSHISTEGRIFNENATKSAYMSVFNCIKRLFHSYGHGVHSPLAYRIITDLRRSGRYGFYADHYTELTCQGDRLAERTAIMAIRLIHILLPGCIWIPGEQGESIRRSLRHAYKDREISGARECPSNADFIILFRDDTDLKRDLPITNGLNCTILTVPPAIDESVRGIRDLSPTLTIRSGWYTLFCRRKGMAPTEYDIL